MFTKQKYKTIIFIIRFLLVKILEICYYISFKLISHIRLIILYHVYKMTTSSTHARHTLCIIRRTGQVGWLVPGASPTLSFVLQVPPRSNLILPLRGTTYCRKHLLPSREALHHKEHLSPYEAVPHEVVVGHVAPKEVLALL